MVATDASTVEVWYGLAAALEGAPVRHSIKHVASRPTVVLPFGSDIAVGFDGNTSGVV